MLPIFSGWGSLVLLKPPGPRGHRKPDPSPHFPGLPSRIPLEGEAADEATDIPELEVKPRSALHCLRQSA